MALMHQTMKFSCRMTWILRQQTSNNNPHTVLSYGCK
jgi:hypothetical protein